MKILRRASNLLLENYFNPHKISPQNPEHYTGDTVEVTALIHVHFFELVKLLR